MGKWRDFEFDLSCCDEARFQIVEAEHHRIYINLYTAYQNGSGWGSEEAIRDYGSAEAASEAFRTEITSKLEECGFSLTSPPAHSGTCPTLYSKKENQLLNDKLSVYLHPMEFSGYASEKQLQAIMEVLDTCETVKDYHLTRDQIVYDVKDWQYETILKANAERIARHIAEHYPPKRRYPDEVAFDFARECRIDRPGDSSALTSSDIDIKIVTDICDYAQRFDYFKKLDREIKKEKQNAERS